jgi:hypothetical protein
MGKMMSSTSLNIDIGSTFQFPEYEMPALAVETPSKSSKAKAGPSYSTVRFIFIALSQFPFAINSSFFLLISRTQMLATPTAQKSLWPSLSSNKKAAPSSSFFGDDKKIVHVTGNKDMMATTSKECGGGRSDSDDDDECKAPVYKNSLSDALAKALSLNENMSTVAATSGKKSKKKTKKTLLFSSGMNFN